MLSRGSAAEKLRCRIRRRIEKDRALDASALIRCVSHHDPANPNAAWQAALALGDCDAGGPEDRAAVRSALESALFPPAHALTRAHVAETLGRLGDARSTQALMRALEDEHHLVRTYAIASLEKLGEESAIGALLIVLTDDSFFGARAAAASAIGRRCRERVSPLCDQARETLRSQRVKEEGSEDARSWRVLREIALALSEEPPETSVNPTGSRRVLGEKSVGRERLCGPVVPVSGPGDRRDPGEVPRGRR